MMSSHTFTARALLLVFFCAAACGGDESAQVQIAEGPVINSLGKQLPPDAAPLHEQILMYFIEEPKTLDVSMDNYGVKGADPFLFERLTMFDADDILIPGASDRWEPSEDGRTWTFHLREGARWSDGRDVTAHDFEYTFKRFLDPDEGNVFAFLFYNIKNARDFNHGKINDPDSVGVARHRRPDPGNRGRSALPLSPPHHGLQFRSASAALAGAETRPPLDRAGQHGQQLQLQAG